MPRDNYKKWFNNKYFQIYYSHRNYREADRFIDKLFTLLHPPKNSSAIDLCCGNGRYAIALNKRGLNVLGVDFSRRQIASAKKFENDTLKFVQADIEKFIYNHLFDYAFNFFSSFGYRSEKSNIKILEVIHKQLRLGGRLVLDFWNPAHDKYKRLMDGATILKFKKRQGIKFQSKAYIKNGVFKKEINIFEKRSSVQFKEKIMVITIDSFKKYFKSTGFVLKKVYGNYALEGFNEANSERMIFLLEKV